MNIYVLIQHRTYEWNLSSEDSFVLVKGFMSEVDALDAYDKLSSMITPGDGVDSYELRTLNVKEHTL